jgi:hypothetical protein
LQPFAEVLLYRRVHTVGNITRLYSSEHWSTRCDFPGRTAQGNELASWGVRKPDRFTNYCALGDVLHSAFRQSDTYSTADYCRRASIREVGSQLSFSSHRGILPGSFCLIRANRERGRPWPGAVPNHKRQQDALACPASTTVRYSNKKDCTASARRYRAQWKARRAVGNNAPRIERLAIARSAGPLWRPSLACLVTL